MISSRAAGLLLAATVFFSALGAVAAEPTGDTNALWFAEHYAKFEHRIPMRDGVRLFTRVFVPKDDSQPWPIMLTRTPYALKPYGANNYSSPAGTTLALAKDKFVLASQDVRGRYGSEGDYLHILTSSWKSGAAGKIAEPGLPGRGGCVFVSHAANATPDFPGQQLCHHAGTGL